MFVNSLHVIGHKLRIARVARVDIMGWSTVLVRNYTGVVSSHHDDLPLLLLSAGLLPILLASLTIYTLVSNSCLRCILPGPQVVPALLLAIITFVYNTISLLYSWCDAIRRVLQSLPIGPTSSDHIYAMASTKAGTAKERSNTQL